MLFTASTTAVGYDRHLSGYASFHV